MYIWDVQVIKIKWSWILNNTIDEENEALKFWTSIIITYLRIAIVAFDGFIYFRISSIYSYHFHS